MWQYIGDGSRVSGVLSQDMTDEEFAAASARFAALEGGAKLEDTGLWKQAPDARTKPPTPAKED